MKKPVMLDGDSRAKRASAENGAAAGRWTGALAVAAVAYASLLLGANLPEARAEELSAQVLDPVYVFYPRGSCRGDLFELERWHRLERRWVPHPIHAQVAVESCQLEDAGVLLNEIRRRCIEEPDGGEPPPWIVGLDVFDPLVMERCEVGSGPPDPDIEIGLEEGGPGTVVQSLEKRIGVAGGVTVGGLPAHESIVVIAIDRSEGMRDSRGDRLRAQTDAAKAFVSMYRSRLGRSGVMRIGIVVHPNMPPEPGSGGNTAARWWVPPSRDAVQLARSLDRLALRGPVGIASEAAALEFAIVQLARIGSERPSAARHVMFAVDGRTRDPFAAPTTSDAARTERWRELAVRADRAKIALHLFSLGGVADGGSEFARQLAGPRGSAWRILDEGLRAPFFLRVAVPWVETVHLANLSIAPDPVRAELDRAGRFQATLDAVPGENHLLAEVRLSDGRREEREWMVEFDDEVLRAELQRAEAERIRRLRRQGGERTVEVEPERP